VSFTGSTATGRKVMAAAAPTVKRVFLELGGKSAFVVLDDADLSAACATAAFMVCTHAGQGCAITTRLVVPRRHFDEAVDVTAATLKGHSWRPATPRPGYRVRSADQRAPADRVERYIRLAREEGGTIVVGGGRPADKTKGFFVEPTLVVGLARIPPVAQEEIFGPVLVVVTAHDGDDDAVPWPTTRPTACRARCGRATATGPWPWPVVCARGRWGQRRCLVQPRRALRRLQAVGMGREMGVAGFEEYLETKSIAEPA
jgi:aldehyde dehydrogenase (NAD+)